MRKFGLGVLKMRPEDLGWMLLGDLLDAIIGHDEDLFERYKAEAELTRMQTLLIVNSIPGRQQILRDPKDLWKFGWELADEKPKESKELTPEESAERMKFFTRHFGLTDKPDNKE